LRGTIYWHHWHEQRSAREKFSLDTFFDLRLNEHRPGESAVGREGLLVFVAVSMREGVVCELGSGDYEIGFWANMHRMLTIPDSIPTSAD
jgi:hypothetical protein